MIDMAAYLKAESFWRWLQFSVENRIPLSLTSRYFESVSARNKWVTRLQGTTRWALSRRSSYIAECLLQKTTDSMVQRGWTLSFSARPPHRQAPGIGTGRQASRQTGSNSRLQRPNAGMQQANAMTMKVCFSLGLNNFALFRAFAFEAVVTIKISLQTIIAIIN